MVNKERKLRELVIYLRYVLLIEKNKLLSDNILKRKLVGSMGPQGRMLKVYSQFY